MKVNIWLFFSKDLCVLLDVGSHTNAAIYGRSVVAACLRIFANKVTAHGVPQDCFVIAFSMQELCLFV